MRCKLLVATTVVRIVPFVAIAGVVHFCLQPAAAQAPVPPDLPLAASPPLDEAWLRDANIIQPYGHSAYVFLTDEDRPARLNRELGFNVVIVQPPDSHNTIAGPNDQLTEEQFREGLARCRAVGYRVLLYTSVMAIGLSPEFQSGQIAREHPEWLQRDAKGNHVMVWGVPWLCPNSGAREAALDRCLHIVREYSADGIMLDNNQFFMADAGWTCHCDHCTRAFREYLQDRFGVDGSQQFFGAKPEELSIPDEEGPLHASWLQWRNRVWAEINESFRARLREANPKVMLFANTQYKFDTGMLASDMQYEREDVVLSESVGLGARQMSEKMVLGHALAAGRPLWNYIGTFSKADDYTGLLPTDTVRPMVAATIAHNARPWIVDGFDEGPSDADARDAMAKLLLWHSNHREWFNKPRWSPVAALVSTTSRNIMHRPIIPPHIADLQAAGVPVIALRDDSLTVAQLRPLELVTIELSTCLADDSITALASWVRQGGTLLATPETGSHDELGRRRRRSRLWDAVGIAVLPAAGEPAIEQKFGAGRVIVAGVGEFADRAIELSKPFSFVATPFEGSEVVAYCDANTLLLHVLDHKPNQELQRLQLPTRFKPTGEPARLYTPDGDNNAQRVPLESTRGITPITLPGALPYSVLEIAIE